METKLEKFIAEKHYKEIATWWKAQDWPVIGLDYLSKNGVVVFVDGVMSAAGWIYQMDSKFCLFEAIVANPLVRKEKRKLAFDRLFEGAKIWAKEMGFGAMITMTNNQSLKSRLERTGYEKTDENMSHYVFSLGDFNG